MTLWDTSQNYRGQVTIRGDWLREAKHRTNLSYERLQNNGLPFKGQEKEKLNAKFGCYLLGTDNYISFKLIHARKVPDLFKSPHSTIKLPGTFLLQSASIAANILLILFYYALF